MRVWWHEAHVYSSPISPGPEAMGGGRRLLASVLILVTPRGWQSLSQAETLDWPSPSRGRQQA